MAKPNLFLVSPKLSQEDRFTAHWHYILTAFPSVGQQVIDYVAKKSGIPPTRFLAAVDHPTGDQRNRPDFEIEGDDYSIVFEHKIVSELGNQQLERYLGVVSEREQTTYLSFVSSRLHEIQEAVTGHPRYLRPNESASHFTWQEFGEILKKSRLGLVKEFVHYMGVQGLLNMPWAGLGDPFTDEIAGSALREVLRTVAENTRRKGCSIRMSTKSIGMEYRKPLPGIHLIYFYASPHFAGADERLSGRVFSASVWIKHEGGYAQPKLPDAWGYIDSEPRIYVSDEIRRSSWDTELFVERRYEAAFTQLLGNSRSEAANNITDFVHAVLSHLEIETGLIPESRELGTDTIPEDDPAQPALG